MDRSLKAVLVGTFTLRFSTGLTGAMLQLYLSHFKEFHPETGAVSALTVGVFAATFYLAELVLSPLFGVLSDRLGHHRVMVWGPIFGGIAVVLTAISGNLLVIGGPPGPEGPPPPASLPALPGHIPIPPPGHEAPRG